MDIENARRLILKEGMSGDAVYLDVRMGRDPGADRMSHLLGAIEALVNGHRCGPQLDRTLTFALWAISLHTPAQAQAWQNANGPWRDGAFDNEINEFSMKAEEYLFRDVDFKDASLDKPLEHE